MVHILNQPDTTAMIPMTEDELLFIQGGFTINGYYVPIPSGAVHKVFQSPYYSSVDAWLYSGFINPETGLRNP